MASSDRGLRTDRLNRCPLLEVAHVETTEKLMVYDALKFALKACLSKRFGLTQVEVDRLACNVGFVSEKTTAGELVSFLKSIQPTPTSLEPIRVGAQYDGGYVVPDDLEGVQSCYSPGVSNISEFELDCAKRGMDVYLADASVDGPATAHPKFHFQKKYIGAVDTDVFMTLESWLGSTDAASAADLILQMDIESYEYESLLALSDEWIERFRIMVIEFHDFDHLWSKPFFLLVKALFQKLMRSHVCYHLHVNNFGQSVTKENIDLPMMCEITFVRKDRLKTASTAKRSPSELDNENDPNRPKLSIRHWHTGTTKG